MTATSHQLKVIRYDPAAFDMYNPIDAATAWMVKNNLAHLTDESCQTRINWVSSGNDIIRVKGNGSTTGPIIWHQLIPWTWLAQNKPANADIYVRGWIYEAETFNFRARLVPYSAQLGDLSAPAILDVENSVTSSVNAVVLDTQQIVDPSLIQNLWNASRLKGHPGDEDPLRFATMFLMRLEIHISANVESEGGIYLSSVYLREFA